MWAACLFLLNRGEISRSFRYVICCRAVEEESKVRSTSILGSIGEFALSEIDSKLSSEPDAALPAIQVVWQVVSHLMLCMRYLRDLDKV